MAFIIVAVFCLLFVVIMVASNSGVDKKHADKYAPLDGKRKWLD